MAAHSMYVPPSMFTMPVPPPQHYPMVSLLSCTTVHVRTIYNVGLQKMSIQLVFSVITHRTLVNNACPATTCTCTSHCLF